MTIARADVIEAETFLYKHADIEAVDLLLPDSRGALRGKRVKRDALAKVYQQGAALPASLFTPLSSGDADRTCWPVPGTLRPQPHSQRPQAQLLLTMCELDGRPFFADPRHVLDLAVERFDELKLTPSVAFELEFYLLDKRRTSLHGPQPPEAPLTGRREMPTQGQVYGLRQIELFDELLDSMVKAAEAQELPVEGVVAKHGPVQYEINLGHRSDPFAACDDALLLKRLVKATAEAHGLDATFMAKPYQQHAGSGSHVHVSLHDDDGVNVFQDADSGGDPGAVSLANPLLRQAAAGLAATLAEATALCAPNPNAFRRLATGEFAPPDNVWGFNNRALALRVPSGPASARRIEHRLAGADANPYLLLAGALAGIHYGISRQLETPPSADNAAPFGAGTGPGGLPGNAAEALAAFATGSILPEYLGSEFCRSYHAIKAAELAAFERVVTPLEHQWYL